MSEISDEMVTEYNRAHSAVWQERAPISQGEATTVAREATRAGLAAALVASGWRPEADVLREAAEGLRKRERRLGERGMSSQFISGIHYAASALSARANEIEPATALEPSLPLPVADGREVERESIEDALENDRCGICGSVEHFREDHPVSAGIPLPPASNELREHPGTGQPMEAIEGIPDGVEREYVLGQERSEEQEHG